MPEPEISHRCPSCGVSVRDSNALFCYECGKPLSKTKNSEPAEAGEASHSAPAKAEEPQATKTAEVTPAASPTGEPEPIRPDKESLVSDTDDKEAKPEDSPKVAGSVDTHPAARRGEKTRERLHRASEVARGVTRGVIEEPAKRVEKIRQVSTVMIEEATYDPSLRFVLVALGLFVVFIILLVVSKVMG